MSLYDSAVCFVCAHLAAHRENVTGRNSDFKNIYERSFFPSNSNVNKDDFNSNNDAIVMPSQGYARNIDRSLYVQDHDIVFWIGMCIDRL